MPAILSPFETPHPTLEAQTQAYKLPSSKPVQSPTPLSPVRIPVRTNRSSTAGSQPDTTLSSSKHFKENTNGRGTKPQRHSTRTLSSMTLTSGLAPDPLFRSRSFNQSQTRVESRSASRSSNSSTTSSHDGAPSTKTKSQSKLSKSKGAKGAKPKFISASSEPIVKTLLASPFASKVSSPTNYGFPAHTTTTAKKDGRTETLGLGLDKKPGLSDTYFDPNAPARSRTRDSQRVRSKKGRASQSLSTHNSPEKSEGRVLASKRSRRRLKGNDENAVLTQLPWKNRRPSAPSNLQRPTKLLEKAFVPSRMADEAADAKIEVEDQDWTGKRRLASGLEIQLAAPPALDQVNISPTGPESDNGCEADDMGMYSNHDPLSWMTARSMINFNRPPSQMSVFMDFEEEDGLDHDFGHGFDLGVNYGGIAFDPRATSTPSKLFVEEKRVLTRTQSLPTLGGSTQGPLTKSGPVKARSSSMDLDCKPEVSDGDLYGRSGEEDMELTAPLQGAFGDEEPAFQDHTPWVTDSIISPPTEYIQEQNGRGRALSNTNRSQHIVREESDTLSSSTFLPVQTEDPALTSPFGSSYAKSTSSSGSSSLGLDEAFVLKDGPLRGVGDESDKRQVPAFGGAQRTRSGTIIASKPGPAIARRTRTGTIVGPTSIPVARTRSGTIRASKTQDQGMGPPASVRTGGGTVVGPFSGPSSSFDVGHGSKVDSLLQPQAPASADTLPEAVVRQSGVFDEADDGGLVASIGNGLEVEGYADSAYLPRLSSSPDPLNIIGLQDLIEEEGRLGFDNGPDGDLSLKEMVWAVSDEPPSPEIRKRNESVYGRGKRGGILAGRGGGRGSRSKNAERRPRFRGTDGQVEEREDFSDLVQDVSDDELMLIDEQTASLL